MKLRKVDQAFLAESRSERKLLARSGDLADFLEKMGSAEEVKKLATDKIEQIVQRYPDHKSLAKLTALFEGEIRKSKNR